MKATLTGGRGRTVATERGSGAEESDSLMMPVCRLRIQRPHRVGRYLLPIHKQHLAAQGGVALLKASK